MGCLRVNKTTIAPLLIGALLPLLGCGGDDDKPKPRPTPTPTSPPTPQPTAFLIPVLPGAQRQANLGNAVSHDGRVEVGGSESAGGMQAFRWTAGGDLQALGFLPGYTDSSEATAVSADGSVVAGASTAASGESRAFIWTAETGMQPLGELPDFIVCSQALAMSVDGTVVVGTGEGVDPNYGDDKTLCFRWTADEGFHWFGDFLPAGVEGTLCEAYGISSDGRVIVGAARYDVAEDDTPLVQGFRFTSDPGLFPLGWVDDATPESSALSASANGAVIGGSSDQHTETGPLESPMRWTTAVGPVWLGRGLVGDIRAVSADGSAMAGGAADRGTAFVWDIDNGYRNLYGLLLQTGLADGLEGTSPITVNGMTPAGRIVVGTSLGDGRPRAYYVRLP